MPVEGMRRHDEAPDAPRSHALEATLGGKMVAAKIRAATTNHDVLVWFCGLVSVALTWH